MGPDHRSLSRAGGVVQGYSSASQTNRALPEETPAETVVSDCVLSGC